jgi:dTDP-4-dehydrorhamnose reductase
MACILISGGSGFLGHNLILGLAREHRVIAGFHSTRLDLERALAVPLDVTQPAQLAEQFTRLKPDLVVHAAALSQPDECERDPGRAQGVIVDGSRNMAQASREFGFRLVHISTDLVFDGTKGNYREEDQVRGISVYSRTKIEAERLVREIAPSAIILRIAVLYGPGNRDHPGFVDSVMARWRSGQPMTFYVDQYRTPTFAPQVADVVQKLLLHPESAGVFHLGGSDRLSRYDFGLLLARQVRAPGSLVQAGSMWDPAGAAPRGADCSLVSSKIVELLGVKPLTCSEGLEKMCRDGYLSPLSRSIDDFRI